MTSTDLVDLGGGEKDVLLILPIAAVSIVFALTSLLLWGFGASLGRASRIAALTSITLLLAAFVAVVAWSWR